MERAVNTPFPLPRIWAVGISRLGALYRDIAAAYDPVANLTLVTRGFEEALRDLENAGADRPDVIVAAGSNGNYLKTRVDIPVVLVTPTGFDVMHALARARREGSRRLALVMHGETPVEVLRFCTVFGIDVRHASYLSAEDAEGCVLDLRDRGVDAIVGPGLVTEIAERAGMKAVFLYSRASVQAALDTALEVARATLGERARRRRLDQIMQNLRDGVLALNAQGGIEAMSARMAEMLRCTPSQVIGRQLAAVAPEIAAVVPAVPGESLESVRGASYLVHRSVWGDPGQAPVGALVTFQASVAMPRLDRSVRAPQRGQRASSPARYCLDDMIGECAAIAALRQRVLRYAATDATVLIRGESGTGKELVAQSLHHASARRDGAFVALNCSAFPESLLESELFGYEEGAFTGARRGGKPGLFEIAHHGTVFLDEIGEMPRALQGRLLRVLQEREVVRLGSGEPIPVDVRIIAATHRPLLERIETGEFRADLYYRLNILNVALPPLRERGTDMALLASHLLLRTGRVASREAARQILNGVLPMLADYRWPGNVRELQNVIERIGVELAPGGALAGTRLTGERLGGIAPELIGGDRRAFSLKARARRIEIDEIRTALAGCGGDRDKACAVLGISKTTLWRRLREA
ncbi:propionate catabolism operon regulatory protein PrpR [Robbsia sp. Bb-Pol-6]|uniref:Propionate catabolism operon regulatory protein PrpR n=1 Tax=Robbsia betulipollinis TaxID=2981849 RepID=A0ABT3ZGZ4_9BURK|nr:propionate catabolism operon regulatory protein PrpR [Robbsia betulipollinis]MCY0385801.1 propionate catabolism operon regulatory protein PrpR [Robbsia betulipollinis]